MNTKVVFIVLMLFAVSLTSVYATTDTIGGCTAGLDIASYIQAYQITASGTGTLNSLGAGIFGGTANLKIALYSDSAGAASILLANTTSLAVSGAGFYYGASNSPVSIVSGTPYWIAWETSGGASSCTETLTNTQGYQASDYTAFPSTAVGFSYASSGYTYELGMNYTPTITTTTTTLISSSSTTTLISSSSTLSSSTLSSSTLSSSSTTTLISSSSTLSSSTLSSSTLSSSILSSTTLYSSTTTVSQAYPSNLTNATKVSSLPLLLSYTLALPFAGYGFVLLAFGMVWVLTKRMRTGLLAGFLMSIVLSFISASLVSPALVIVLLVFVFISSYLDLHKKGNPPPTSELMRNA